jgi:hypothetical protein
MARDYLIREGDIQIREQYPDGKYLSKIDNYLLINIKSITYNVYFRFFPYDVKITESLTPEWNKETVIGRMDPISTFKRMGRTMNLTFKIKARYGDDFKNRSTDPAFLPVDELLHTVDHFKRVLYPRYNEQQVMTSPPLFRIKYGNLIHAGENTMGADNDGVLCTIDSFGANPIFSPNSIYVKAKNTTSSENVNIGEKNAGFYPNGFDVSIGFTIFNEELSKQSSGILNNKYFYDFVESIHKSQTETENSFFDNNSNIRNVDDDLAPDNSIVTEENKAALRKALKG